MRFASSALRPNGFVVITAFLCLQQSITAASCKLLGNAIHTISTFGFATASSISVVQCSQA